MFHHTLQKMKDCATRQDEEIWKKNRDHIKAINDLLDQMKYGSVYVFRS